MISIFDQVKEILEKNKGQRIRVAREAGVSYQWITSILSGDNTNPTLQNCEKILRWHEIHERHQQELKQLHDAS